MNLGDKQEKTVSSAVPDATLGTSRIGNLVPEKEDNSPNIQLLGGIYRLVLRSIEHEMREDEEEHQRVKDSEKDESNRNKEIIKALTGRTKKKVNQEVKDIKSDSAESVTKPSMAPPKQPAPTTSPPTTSPPTTSAPRAPTPSTTSPIIPGSIVSGAVVGTIISSLGISAAAAISIKGETGATTKKDMLAKGAQIVPNDPSAGVFSYGIFGMNSKAGTVSQFINQNPQLGFTEKPGTPQFNQQWKQIANQNPQELFDAQIAWHERNIIQPLKRDLQKQLPSAVQLDDKILTYMADRRIQYGKTLEGEAFSYASDASNSDEFIDKITEFDINNIDRAFKTYLKNNPNNAPGLIKRIQNRKKLAVELTSENNNGKVIDESSKRNYAAKEELKKKSTGTVTNNTTINESQSSGNSESNVSPDDRPIILKKAD